MLEKWSPTASFLRFHRGFNALLELLLDVPEAFVSALRMNYIDYLSSETVGAFVILPTGN